MTPLFAAVNWLDISISLLLVIHVIICLLLALVVLMQRPKQEGLGAAFGSGLTDQAFGARTTDVLQKGTVYLGTFFFIVTLVLAILIGKRQRTNPVMQPDAKPTTEESAPAATTPVTLPETKEKTPVVMPEPDKKVEPAPKKVEPVKPDGKPADKPADKPAPKADEKKPAESTAPKPPAPAKPVETPAQAEKTAKPGEAPKAPEKPVEPTKPVEPAPPVETPAGPAETPVAPEQ